jgi:hypothetical protein
MKSLIRQTLAMATVAAVALAVLLPLGWFMVWIGGVIGLSLYLCFMSLALAAAFVPIISGMLFSAPYVPIRDVTLAAMIKLAAIREGETVYDLGSGDGCILIAAAKEGALTEGWEINPYLCAWSWLAARWYGVGARVKVHCASYWNDSYGQADVIALYLLPAQMKRLEGKLLKELRPGARVVSAGFRFPNWPPTAELENAHLYVVPPKS